MNAYAKLEERFARIADLSGAMGILGWDNATMMPTGSSAVRGEQLATLNVICHELRTDPAVSGWIEEASAESLDPWQTANLLHMRRSVGGALALPPKLVEALSLACNETEMLWREARRQSDYAMVVSQFANLLNLTREAADAHAAYWKLPPYEVQLDFHQYGLRTAHIDPIFDRLQAILPGMADRAIELQARRPAPRPLPTGVDEAAQMRFCKALAERAGFDFTIGRMDVSTHPFSGGCQGDVRMTTRFTASDMLEPITATLHESGHSVYEMNLPVEWRRQPVGSSNGMMIHESQSLLYEMQAGLSPAFTRYMAREAAQAFGDADEAWTQENLGRHLTHVERSFIRVGADELTYPLHVILRYRLEQAMLSGDLAAADLPGAFNEWMKKTLGIVPPDDAQGCLQDPHWFTGEIGYFPTYTLGAVLAAQLFAAAKAAHPGIDEQLQEGNFSELRGWLNLNVHSLGQLHDAPTLIRCATGKPLGTEDFEAHLTRRYLDA